jgi:hypothetical protein
MHLDPDADKRDGNENDEDDAHPSLQTRGTAKEALGLSGRDATPYSIRPAVPS